MFAAISSSASMVHGPDAVAAQLTVLGEVTLVHLAQLSTVHSEAELSSISGEYEDGFLRQDPAMLNLR